MIGFLKKRLPRALLVLLGVSLLSFFSLRLVPGDPVKNLLGERGADPEAIGELKSSLGLDKPLYTQYFLFLKNLSRGNLGKSIVTGEPVLKEFFSYFPATVELAFLAMLFSLLLGIPLGLFAAINKGSFFDKFVIGFSLFGFSMSIFWWALVLILIFSVWLGITPVSGRLSALYDIPSVTGFYLIDSFFGEEKLSTFLNSLKHLILPSLTLATIPLAFIVRITRASLLDILKKEFMKTARAKGLGFYSIFFRHALRNALTPLITITGVLVASLLTGAVLTESIFAWPGIGNWFVKALLSRDYPVINGGVFLMAILVFLINLLADFLLLLVDPKIKEEVLKDEK